MDKDDTNRGSPKKRRRRKSLSPHYQANNKGGFGNPPVRGQFRKNNPGGPGRPKGITNLEAAIRKRLKKKLTVSKEGKSVSMTAFEVYAERVLEAILSKSSSPAMLEYGYGLLMRFSSEETPPTLDYSVFTNDEFRLFGGLLARALGWEPVQGYKSIIDKEYDRPSEGMYRVTRGPDGHIIIERADHPPDPDGPGTLLRGPEEGH